MRSIKSALKDERYQKLNIDILNLNENQLTFRDLQKKSVGFDTGATNTTIKFYVDTFGLNAEQFSKKFMESISGDGDELNKNNALHSSSLCALLCFYNISKKNQFVYKGITYTDVYFEVKNKVVSKPSNMDVVLTGVDKNNKPSILFIECKFSEYMGAHSAFKLGETYQTEEPYKSVFDAIKYSEKKVFQYGLKQLVTHYFGIKNFINRDSSYKKYMAKYYFDGENDIRVSLYDKHFDNVSFIEVVYDFSGNDDYDVYTSETDEVFAVLKEQAINDKLNVNILGTTTYQEFFKDNKDVLNELVCRFYNL